MRAARWSLAAAASLLAATVGAQTLPVPVPPPASPEPGAEAPGTPVEPLSPASPPRDLAPRSDGARPWAYEVSLGLAWDGNINLQSAAAPSDVAVVPGARLARTFSGPRGQLRVAAAGHWVGYAEETGFDRGYAELDLRGRYASSTRTDWKASASYVLGHTDSSQPLLEQGVLLPLVKTRTLTAALGVSHALGSRTSLRMDGRIYRTEFDEPRWLDGQSVRGTVGLERRLGSRDTAAIVYAVEAVRADQVDGSSLTHFGSLQYTRVLTPRTAVLLEAGDSYTPDAGAAGLDHSHGFFGGASLSQQVKRSRLTVFVRREVTPAFGIGVSRLELRAGVDAAVSLGRGWELMVDAIHVAPDEAAGRVEPYAAAADDAALALARRIGDRLALSGRASLRRRGASGTLPPVRVFEAGLELSFTDPSGTIRKPRRPGQ